MFKKWSQTDAQTKPIQEKKKEGVFQDRLMRNIALCTMLLLCIVAARGLILSDGTDVLTVLQQSIDRDWDESLGKLQFVSAVLPESALVFWRAPAQGTLTAPCFAPVTHAWTKQEPYIAYDNGNEAVYSAGEGTVMAVAHGEDEEMILRVRQSDGTETVYYNLSKLYVTEGDAVADDTLLGTTLTDKELLFEVRSDGVVIDPSKMLSARVTKQ